MSTTLMCTDKEIAALFYLKQDSKIANYLGVSVERVGRVRAERAAPAETPAVQLPEPLEQAMSAEPLKQDCVLAPNLCPTCGAPFESRLMITHIQALVSAYYQVPVREMTSARRHKEIARPRQVAMYLAAELTPKSLPDIGRRFGGRDHTTVIHAIKAVQRRMIEDMEIEADVKALRERLSA